MRLLTRKRIIRVSSFIVTVVLLLAVAYKLLHYEQKKYIKTQINQTLAGWSDSIADSPLIRELGHAFGIYEHLTSGAALGDGGYATDASLFDPTGVYVDSTGTVYISERRHHRIRLIRDGIIDTYAGNGRPGYTGDGTSARSSRLNRPEGLDGDAEGNIYVADSFNHRIRRISPDGEIDTIAGTGTPGYSGDGGPAQEAELNGPMDVKFGPSGSLYVLERDNHCVRRISPAGMITTITGTGKPGFSGDGGPAREAQLDTPYGIAVDRHENIYIADSANNRVRVISPGGDINTIAGTGTVGFSGDGGPAIKAQFDSPQAIAVLPNQNIVINDEHNHRIRTIDSNGVVRTIAGSETNGFSGDNGPATNAQLNDPEYLWVDRHGSIYITDGDNNRVRKITPDGTIHTIAGNGFFSPINP